MVQLESIQAGRRYVGIVPGRAVRVDLAQQQGDSATVIWTDGDGNIGRQVLFRDHETDIEEQAAGATWDFSADPSEFKLASEALRIKYAHLFDPFSAVHSSAIQPLPHQIQAVYGCLLKQQPLRFLLADDPGAGKTIMAGLFIKELLLRGDLERCLILAPGAVVDNWQAELLERFSLKFEILSNEMLNTGNPFDEHPFLIARVHHVAWRDDLKDLLMRSDTHDLIIVDEAHKMSASYGTDGTPDRTKLNQLGMQASEHTKNFLLMTATPHSGHHPNFYLFLQLLDQARYAGRYREEDGPPDPSGYMRRMIKEDLYTLDGEKLFPKRTAETAKYALSAPEHQLYLAVTEYVRNEMNRVKRMDQDQGKKNVVGFALTMLQRRLASSPEAIYKSLQNRRKRLKAAMQDLVHRGARQGIELGGDIHYARFGLRSAGDLESIFDDPDAMDSEAEGQLGDEAIDSASAARTVEELAKEVETLTVLERQALEVRNLGTDAKWEHLSGLLQDKRMSDEDGTPRKAIIFTEHAATLEYLTTRIASLLGSKERILVIHGGIPRRQRLDIQERFWYDPEARILVATDAAGEGINLHCANIVINYDMPWNPNKLEQRFGRVHRIGQKRTCFMWNMVAGNTREGQVFETLLAKVERIHGALDGKVYDVLGQAFEGVSLRDLLLRALEATDEDVERLLGDDLERIQTNTQELLQEHATALPGLTKDEQDRLAREMEEAEARRLQPHFISRFFVEAFQAHRGQILDREPGRFEIRRVPWELRKMQPTAGPAPSILPQYARVTFDPELVEGEQYKQPAALLALGHPLLDAVLGASIEKWGEAIERGAILVDEQDLTTTPRLLVYVETRIDDARKLSGGRPSIVHQEFHFLEKTLDGPWKSAGPAPYLDYAVLADVVGDPGKQAEVRQHLAADWMATDWRPEAEAHVQGNVLQEILTDVRTEREARITKIEGLVKDRLDKETMRVNNEIFKLRQKDTKRYALTMQNRERELQELEARRDRRLKELQEEKHLSAKSPRVITAALVVPRTYLDQVGLLAPAAAAEAKAVQDTRTSELAAMERVMDIERGLGNQPIDVGAEHKGWDVSSWTPDGRLRCIEVKARNPDGKTFNITPNEYLQALNKKEQYILAMVRVSEGEALDVRYVRHGWSAELDFKVSHLPMDWEAMWNKGAEPS
jgi:superfamily II DNA or RNA helicase